LVDDSIAVKFEMSPLVVEMSDAVKVVVASLELNTRFIDASPVELPLVTPEVELVIVIVGLDEGSADRNSILSI
tara:strand:- start:539 stop:760 length:222 start_codon:yes stop_codon:yes gene_type:complete